VKVQLTNYDAKDQQDAVEEIGREFLKFLARPGQILGLSKFASQSGIQEIAAQYHANKLVNLGVS